MTTTVEVRFSIPNELIEDIKNLSDYVYLNFVLGLYLDEEISFGKAAKLLSMAYDEFMDFLGRKKIPYFRDTPDEISHALQQLKPI
jgi:predicted HTH domain antitoxin